jgi:hypothetical protein
MYNTTRAIRRCGELLKAIAPASGKRIDLQPNRDTPTRSQAAREAGLSQDQKNTALRLAAIPEKEFEEAVESDHPPTVTELAERETAARQLLRHARQDCAVL